ncbi:MAG: DUF192 domain-containing protein [Patescibacteria group bacterium]
MRWAIFLVLAMILGVFFWMWGGSDIQKEIPFYYKKIMGKTIEIEINNTKITAEIARSSGEKAKGLSGREYLEVNRGMIFLYAEPLIPNFWMKEMEIPLDFIWLMDDKIVEITPNVLPDKGPDYKLYSPKVSVNRVLEVNSGFCQKNGLEIGQSVKYGKDLK